MIYTYTWNNCPEHVWDERDGVSGREVICTQCGIPGELDSSQPEGVYYPAT